jgi:hypothetical protein
MKCHSFSYSVKVWFTCVLLAPFLFFSMGFFLTNHRDDSVTWIVPACLLFSFFEMLFSILTWLLFWMIAELIAGFVYSRIWRKLLASIVGVALTLATFALFPFFDSFTTSNNDYILMLCNCACIGAGALYFNTASPKQPTTTPAPRL